MAFLVPLPPKAPAAILDYEMDWSTWLAAGETISSATVTADSGIDVNPAGKSTSTNGGIVTFWLGGGASSKTYNVTVTVSTNLRTDSRTIVVQVGTRTILGVSA